MYITHNPSPFSEPLAIPTTLFGGTESTSNPPRLCAAAATTRSNSTSSLKFSLWEFKGPHPKCHPPIFFPLKGFPLGPIGSQALGMPMPFSKKQPKNLPNWKGKSIWTKPPWLWVPNVNFPWCKNKINTIFNLILKKKTHPTPGTSPEEIRLMLWREPERKIAKTRNAVDWKEPPYTKQDILKAPWNVVTLWCNIWHKLEIQIAGVVSPVALIW